jgi:hypothetical protein
MIASMYHNAKLKTTLKLAAETRELNLVVDEMIAQISTTIPDKGWEPDPDVKAETQKVKTWVNNGYAQLVRMESLINQIDNYEVGGIWHQAIFQVLSAAQENEDILLRSTMQPILNDLEGMTKAQKKLLNSTVTIDSLGGIKMSVRSMIVVAANTGNDGNFQRLTDGGIFEDETLAKFRSNPKAALSEILGFLDKNPFLWDHVQVFWDSIETLWPMIVALEKRLALIPPEKVKRTPFKRMVVIDGKKTEVEFAGGYFPIVYAKYSKQQNAQDNKGLVVTGSGRATTEHGWINTRVEKNDEPISADYQIVYRHIDSVVRDLTQREAVLQVGQLLKDPRLRRAMINRLGEAVYEGTFLEVLKSISQPGYNETANAWAEKQVAKLRSMLQTSWMGLKYSPVAQNAGNIANVNEMVSAKHLIRSISAFAKNPHGTVDYVMGKSKMMSGRIYSLDRDSRDVLLEDIKSGSAQSKIAKLRRASMLPMAYSDLAVSIPGWLGAYDQSLIKFEKQRKKMAARVKRKLNKEGKVKEVTDEMVDDLIETLAVAEADKTIRLTLTSGQMKDLALLQRKGEFGKLFTLMYGWFGGAFQRIDTLAFDMRVAKSEGEFIRRLPAFISRMTRFLVIPAVWGEFAAGRGPRMGNDDEDDNENVLFWAMHETMLYSLATIPVLGDIAANALDTKAYKQEISFGALGRTANLVDDAIGAFGDIVDIAMSEEKTLSLENLERPAKTALRLTGAVTGLPSSQLIITGGAIIDYSTGERTFKNFWEEPLDIPANLLLTQPRKEQD